MFGSAIYVLPTEEGKPPHAVIGEMASDGFVGVGFTYVYDDDRWVWDHNGMPVPDDIGEATKAHARDLGVPMFKEGG